MRKKSIKPVIVLLAKDIDEELAFLVEEEAINLYGRKDLGKGTLLNLTDGGGGVFALSKNARAKIGATSRITMSDTATKQKVLVALQSEEAWAKRKKSIANAWADENRRNKQSEIVSAAWDDEKRAKQSLVAKQRPKFACPHCGKFAQISNLTRWHGDKCKSKI